MQVGGGAKSSAGAAESVEPQRPALYMFSTFNYSVHGESEILSAVLNELTGEQAGGLAAYAP